MSVAITRRGRRGAARVSPALAAYLVGKKGWEYAEPPTESEPLGEVLDKPARKPAAPKPAKSAPAKKAKPKGKGTYRRRDLRAEDK